MAQARSTKIAHRNPLPHLNRPLYGLDRFPQYFLRRGVNGKGRRGATLSYGRSRIYTISPLSLRHGQRPSFRSRNGYGKGSFGWLLASALRATDGSPWSIGHRQQAAQ